MPSQIREVKRKFFFDPLSLDTTRHKKMQKTIEIKNIKFFGK